MKRLVQGPRNRGRRYNGSHGKSVTYTLGHGNDVGRHAVRLEIPKMLPGPAETRLHFVGYAQAAVAPDQLVDSLQITLGELDHSSDTL